MLIIAMPASSMAQTKTVGDKVTIDGNVELDKTVHDFGDILYGSGPVSCKFTIKNISSSPMAIYDVASSCGCTAVDWTKQPIQPGKTGVINATFDNEDGPHPFDKRLTVYFSNVKKPVVLRLRGTAYSKKLPLSEAYPIHLGNLGLKEKEIKLGNMSQGSQRSDVITVANIGKSPIKVAFEGVSEGMDIKISPSTIQAGETAKITYTITANRKLWGKNWYYATPVVNGKKTDKIAIWAFTKEDFSGWSEAQRKNAAMPVFDESTFEFGVVKPGKTIDAEFELKNEGKETLHIYKADVDIPGVEVVAIPDVKAGKKGTYKFRINTSKLPKGEIMGIVTLTTNTPNRPIINLFLSGAVK